MQTSTKFLLAALALGLAIVATLLIAGGDDVDLANAPVPSATNNGEPSRATVTGEREVDREPASDRVEVGAERTARTDELPSRSATGTGPQFELTVIARCVTPEGVPIAGARLVAAEVEGQPGVQTDADGRARLVLAWPAKLITGNHHWIVITATSDGMTKVQHRHAVEGTHDHTVTLGDIVLRPGGDVSGTVLDAGGRPAAGAFVWIVRGCRPTSGVAEEERRVRGRGFHGLGVGTASWTRTDEQGHYDIEGLPAETISVVARRAGHLCAYTTPFDVRVGSEVEAPTLRLETIPDRNRIAGIVSDSAGSPISNALIDVFENRGPRNIDPIASGGSGADGRFELLVLSGQRYTLDVEDRSSRGRRTLVHDVAAGADDVVVRFAPERPFEFAILSIDGSPVDVTRTWATDETGHHLELAWREGADGERTALAPEQTFTLWASAAGHRTGRVGPFDSKTLPARVELRLEPASTVTGRVTAAGLPVVGATVHAHVVDPRQPMHYFAHEIYTRLEAARGHGVQTDANGQFALPLQRAGTYVLHAEAEGFARGESNEFVVEDGAIAPPVIITLEQPASVEGAVLTGDSTSLEGLIIAATRGDGHVEVCVTDPDGRYRFSGLSSGGWQVRTARPDDQQWLRMARTWPLYEERELPIDVVLAPGQAATFDVDLRDHHAAEIQGRLAIDGVACDGFSVSVWCDGTYERTEVDAGGTFAHRTSPGSNTLHCFGTLPTGGRLTIRHEVELTAGSNPVDVAVRTGGVEFVGLPASAPAGNGARSQGYALVWNDGRYTYRFDPGANGGHRVMALPVGRAELRRRENPRQRVEEGAKLAEVQIVAGEVRQVRVR
jgi:protocatechuate 3,4-dioxygenase beta subunit